MTETQMVIRFVLAALATWRVTHLLALEDGPADLLVSLRRSLGDSLFGKLMDCFYCLSFWVAAPLALLVARSGWEWVLVWLALSGAACLLQGFHTEPVVIHRIPEGKEGEDYGMLRSGPKGPAEQYGRQPGSRPNGDE